jgi:pilus assembly protein CpaE
MVPFTQETTMLASIIADEPVIANTTPLVTRTRIAGFVSDDISLAALRTGLENTDRHLEFRRGDIRNAIRLLETDTDLHAVIADISGLDDPMAALEDLARVCPPDVLVALIGDNTDIAFYRQVHAIGACEYLSKPLTRDAVQTLLRPKLIGTEPDIADRGGNVIAICGAQGGAGATSIGVNLAMQLAETTKAKVALLDLHLQGGETAVLLGVQPGPGLRIALEDPARADWLFLERAAIEINPRVRLIAADEALDAELNITEDGVRHVLDLLRRRFNYIVVDTPVPLVPAFRPVIALSRHVLVLLEAEVTGLRNALALRKVVTGIAGKNRVFTVLNRADRAGGLPRALIDKGLGGPPEMVIPDLGKRMTEAVNRGVPAITRIPALRRHLAPIVREIAGIRTEHRTGWVRRMFVR